jgi:hypothetical protein
MATETGKKSARLALKNKYCNYISISFSVGANESKFWTTTMVSGLAYK